MLHWNHDDERFSGGWQRNIAHGPQKRPPADGLSVAGVSISKTPWTGKTIMPMLTCTQTRSLIPTRIMPKVWAEPETGSRWCDCGKHCQLTKPVVREFARDLYGLHLPERIAHEDVILICMNVWHYARICPFFTMSVADAAVYVNGSIEDDYPVNVALAIVKAFSNKWNGCPVENCRGDWTADNITNGDTADSEGR